MPRNRRHIISKQVYEITLRTKSGIPFPPAEYINLIIEGALARVQRDRKVDLCHIVFMGNHIHILVVVYDQVQAVSFVKELKKSLTDMTKRLLGLRYLSLWESSSLAYVPTVEDITDRIAYFYSNPAVAGLESSIDRYPGVHSWKSFLEADSSSDFQTVKICPWITANNIPLRKQGVSRQADERVVNELRKEASLFHQLVIRPNAWMKVHQIESEEAEIINKRIFEAVRKTEEGLMKERVRMRKGVVGAIALQNKAPTIGGHQPKKRGQRIFVICRDEAVRRDIIAHYRNFCEACYECYLHYRRTFEVLRWPPGAFMPALPPPMNCLSLH